MLQILGDSVSRLEIVRLPQPVLPQSLFRYTVMRLRPGKELSLASTRVDPESEEKRMHRFNGKHLGKARR